MMKKFKHDYMKKITFIFVLIFSSLLFINSDKPNYRIFSVDGKPTDYDELLKQALGADIILFGEMHDNPVAHWLEFELTKSVFAVKNTNLILGAEMFESDDQLKLDEYMNGTIAQKNFEDEAKIWKNYKTDYKPIVEYAKEYKIPFIATNIPRRYAAFVSAHGLDSLQFLTEQAKKYFPPLPINVDLSLPSYKNIPVMGMSHKSSHLAEAQALKDATMAYFILKNYTKGKIFLHFNGSYHSNNHEGITWFLKQSQPKLKILTISCSEQKDFEKLDDENKNLGDFIIVIDEDMIKTN